MPTNLKFSLTNKWLMMVIAIFLLLLLLTGAYLAYAIYYNNKFYPAVSIGELKVGGLSANAARLKLNSKIDDLNENGFVFILGNKMATILPLVTSWEGDLAYPVISFDAEKSLAIALNYGHSQNFFNNLKDSVAALLFSHNFPLFYNINEDELKKMLISRFAELAKPAENAKLIYATDASGLIKFNVTKEKVGEAIDYDAGIKALENRLIKLDRSPITLVTKNEYPTISAEGLLNIDTKAQQILARTPIMLYYDENVWTVAKKQVIPWLYLESNRNGSSEEKATASLNPDIIAAYLKEKIAPQIDQEPIEAKFSMANDRITEFQPSQDGEQLNLSSSTQKIILALLTGATSSVPLIVDKINSTISIANINNLGIKEIVGIGESNFKGSPKNRRHNIAIGANTLNGLLIEPNEEFSLLKALGKVDAKTGYLPELVIKDNKTTPEFGGGLCQIGTTMFRAALATGLPITMRRNHSYRVQYYEPAGTDATIYDPAPDLRFINDTGNYILIQSRIEGDNLFFNFWGTLDGRLVGRTQPKIYNIVKPGSAKIIETLDLKPGEKKCTEKPHSGADTYFDYKVTYPNGDVKEKRFTSHYIPWREVCLLGVEKLSAEENQSKNATTTEAVTP